MRAQVQAVKSHLSRHKTAYIASGVSFTAGAAAMILTTRSTGLIANKQVQFLAWKSNQAIEVYVEALGDPGNIIQDLTTGIIYASQGQAARELGVHPSVVSRHLKGLLPNVKDHVLVKLGKAMVSE